MKFKLILIFGLLFLSACSNAPKLATLPQDCKDPGVTETVRLEKTSKGYSYTFLVYLPPCYDSDSEALYPVIYLIPGRGSGYTAWFDSGIAPVFDESILNREIPPFIVVATGSTNSDPNASVIQQDIIPYVNQQYPVHPDRRYQAVAGGSLGGIAAYRIVLAHPEQFSSAAMFGSGVISGEEGQVKTWLEQMQPELKPRVFLNCGTQDSLMLKRAEIMAGLLYDHQVSHVLHIGQGEHSYNYWVTMFPTYLRWLAEDWQ
ncbi:MAG: hypothetical protein CVU44_01640 [Chloroflexi bacterium HGW-Chloroflexi-6]|nr:MAG: hypothetical protein CVU44_01640 [Chloroflexi bacterium HGW-Chloroflexi-6]